MKAQTNKSTFTSIGIGLLICVCIFLVGTGIQAWQAMIQSGNESNALQFISSTRIKQYKYNTAREMGGFAPTLAELEEFGSLGEEMEGDAVIFSGYKFTMEVNNTFGFAPSSYSIRADPLIRYGFVPTGKRHFYFSPSFVTIKCTEENRQATADDPSI